MRDRACRFYYIKNVTQNLQVNKFQSSKELENLAGGDSENLISDYIAIPSDKSGSGNLELLVADPEEGFHLLYSEEQVYQDDNDKTYHRDLEHFI